jgi:hypothetical protein
MRPIALALLLASCAGGYTHRPYRPVTGTSASPQAELYRAALLAMSDAGLTVEVNDASAGMLVSAWQCGDALKTRPDQCYQRFRIRVSVTDGRYDVAILCNEKEPGTLGEAPWDDCTARDTRPQMLLDQQSRIAAALR